MATIESIVHITTQNERWDSLSWKYYGDPHGYGRIIEANPDLDITTTLPSGVRVLIPVLTAEQAQTTLDNGNLPPWKRT